MGNRLSSLTKKAEPKAASTEGGQHRRRSRILPGSSSPVSSVIGTASSYVPLRASYEIYGKQAFFSNKESRTEGGQHRRRPAPKEVQDPSLVHPLQLAA